MTETAKTTPARAWRWPLAIVGVFATSMTICGITVALAIGDPSVAFEDDYYAKAVDWDATAAIMAESDRLGWTADSKLSGITDEFGHRTLSITLVDADGQPIVGADVNAELFHHARRGDALHLSLKPDTEHEGTYTAIARAPREGLWRVRLAVRQRELRFGSTQDIRSPSEPEGN